MLATKKKQEKNKILTREKKKEHYLDHVKKKVTRSRPRIKTCFKINFFFY